jgi:TPP-dependent 2-oxoacid decarboxylase
MNIKRVIKHYILGQSIKEIEMNRILDKISKKSKLTKREKEFLKLYNETSRGDDRDFMLISKNMVCKKVTELLDKNKVVICDLHDRNGKFGIEIIAIQNDPELESSLVIMKNGERHKIHDKFLYNLIYNPKKDQYSLEEHDEYFEKLYVKNDEN